MDEHDIRHLIGQRIMPLDKFFKAFTPEEAATVVEGWTRLLPEVPVAFAEDVVTQHYRSETRSIQPADLVAAWTFLQQERRRADQIERRRSVATADDLPGKPPWFDEVRRRAAMVAATAREEGRDPTAAVAAMASPVRPQGMAGPLAEGATTTAELRAGLLDRQCKHANICACDHVECRDGWVDEEVVIRRRGRHVYSAVVRCVHCYDAAVMAEELAPKKPKRRWQ